MLEAIIDFLLSIRIFECVLDSEFLITLCIRNSSICSNPSNHLKLLSITPSILFCSLSNPFVIINHSIIIHNSLVHHSYPSDPSSRHSFTIHTRIAHHITSLPSEFHPGSSYYKPNFIFFDREEDDDHADREDQGRAPMEEDQNRIHGGEGREKEILEEKGNFLLFDLKEKGNLQSLQEKESKFRFIQEKGDSTSYKKARYKPHDLQIKLDLTPLPHRFHKEEEEPDGEVITHHDPFSLPYQDKNWSFTEEEEERSQDSLKEDEHNLSLEEERDKRSKKRPREKEEEEEEEDLILIKPLATMTSPCKGNTQPQYELDAVEQFFKEATKKPPWKTLLVTEEIKPTKSRHKKILLETVSTMTDIGRGEDLCQAKVKLKGFSNPFSSPRTITCSELKEKGKEPKKKKLSNETTLQDVNGRHPATDWRCLKPSSPECREAKGFITPLAYALLTKAIKV